MNIASTRAKMILRSSKIKWVLSNNLYVKSWAFYCGFLKLFLLKTSYRGKSLLNISDKKECLTSVTSLFFIDFLIVMLSLGFSKETTLLNIDDACDEKVMTLVETLIHQNNFFFISENFLNILHPRY